MMKRIFPIVFMMTLITISGNAQTIEISEIDSASTHTFSIDGDMLFRGEWRDGGIAEVENDEDYAAFIMERIMMKMEYQHKNMFVRVTPRHVGIWGQSNGGSFNLFEGWLKMQSKQGLFFKIGRQSLSYDDERIIGADDWTMMAMSHDVLKVGFENKHHQIHVIAGFNQNGEKTEGGTFYKDGYQPYKSMQTIWYHYNMPKVPIGLSLMFLNIGMESGTEKDYHTENQQLMGTYITYHPKHFNVEASYYYQTGHNEYKIPIYAWMASAKVSYKPNTQWGIAAGYDYMSGDRNFAVPQEGSIGLAQHKTIRGFAPLFGSHHKFYGAMDFFYVQNYTGSFTPGLQNVYVKGNYKPITSINLSAAYHYMATGTKLNDLGWTLGHEFELTSSWNFAPNAILSAGYSFMKGSKTMEALKRTSKNRQLQWLWLGLIVKPHLFKAKL